MKLRSMTMHQRQGGMTLVELMVGMLLALILSLALVLVLSSAEGRKRTITSGNDMQQAGTYATHLLDTWLRDAGAGYSKSAAYSFGCPITAYYTSGTTVTKVLPASAAFPDPFGSVLSIVGGTLRLAPVLIVPNANKPSISGQNSDALIIMSGAAGSGGVPAPYSDFADVEKSSLYLGNAYSVQENDLLLLTSVEPSSTANYASNGTAISSLNAGDCFVEQASSTYTSGAGTVPMAGAFHNPDTSKTTNKLASMSDNSTANVIGNVSSNRPPQFMVVGVGDNNTLYSYDLLRTSGSSSAVARADGVFELHALYGFDTDCSGTISKTEWIKATNSTYGVTTLMGGSVLEPTNRPTSASARSSACSSLTTANDYLQKILAVRVGLILRTSLPEKEAVTTSALTLFSDLSSSSGTDLTYTRTLASDEQYYRYRTMEFTIPLRNTLMLP